MKIAVETDRCQGHALCHMNAPELFAADDVDGHAIVLVDGVPPDLRDVARGAMRACPERAISLDSGGDE